MARFLNAFLVFIIATLTHWFFIEIFSPLDIVVGVMFAFSLIIAARGAKAEGYAFAFFSGLFLDFFGNVMFGGYALVFTIAMLIFYHIEDKIDFKEAGPQIIITMALSFFAVILYGILGKIFTGTFLWQGFKSLVLGSMITGLLLPVLYLAVVKYFTFESVKKIHEQKGLL